MSELVSIDGCVSCRRAYKAIEERRDQSM
uniref:Uncharacterized protein n=1 Tax=Leersia perrieri TaxID=77586 RepID=A0A0D9VC55_9ORYZ